MNWQHSTTSPATGLTDSATCQALKSALASCVKPSAISEANPTKSTADSDDRSSLVRVGIIETLAVTPWSDGDYSGTKRSASFYLSAADAQEIMAERIETTGWQSAFLMMVLGDSEKQILEAIQKINEALPVPEMEKAKRRSELLTEHESQKRFMPAERINTSVKTVFASVAYDQSVTAQNIATVQAISSDQPPETMLEYFIQKREARLQKISEAATPVAGVIQYSMKLTGNMKSAIEEATPPNPQAPLAIILAIGGSADQMNAFYEVTGL